MEAIGLPHAWVEVTKLLYHGNLQIVGNSGINKFIASTGTRRGCQLSPLLFAVVAELLLRMLQQRFPSAMARAFADDTAMVNPGVFCDQRVVFDTFADDAGRDAHLTGKVAAALMDYAPVILEGFEASAIQKIYILTSK